MSTLPPQSKETSGKAAAGQAQSRVLAVRTRTYVIGLIAVLVVSSAVAYAELVASRLGSIDSILLGATHMPPGAIGVLILLILANSIIGRASKRLRLNRAELAVIYFMLVCAALLTSFGLVAQLIPTLAGTNYFADPQDHLWKNTFFPHIAKWLVPWDPKGPEKQWVSVSFYEGLKTGQHIPWGKWVVPVAAWLTFCFLVFFLMGCVGTLFRRQWVDNEKLTFPLVTLPMKMIDEESRNSFWRNRVMWLGFSIPAFVYVLNGLHRSFPTVPQLTTSTVLNTYAMNGPWRNMCYTPINLAFSVVGFAYLLPLDVSFSFWFFFVFFRFQDYIRLSLNHQLDIMPLYGGSRYYQGMQSSGAFVTIVIMMLWFARPHLRLVRDRVFGAKSGIDRDEYMSYRVAFWGGIVSFVLIVAWLTLAGVNPLVAAFMMAAFVFIVMLVLTRCVAEIGLLMLEPVFRPMDLWSIVAPKQSIGVGNLTVLSFVNGIFFRNPRTLMPAFTDGMKGADLAGVRKRPMAVGALLSVVVGSIFAVIFHLWLTYNHGGIHMNSWFYMANPQIYLNEASSIVTGNQPFRPDAALWFGVGSLFTFFLYAMRTRFWWWPFHPLGYAMGCAWAASVYWSSFFVGWLVRSLIQRYGGARIYGRLQPFFLGLILGEFTMAILWAVLNFIFGLTTPAIPLG